MNTKINQLALGASIFALALVAPVPAVVARSGEQNRSGRNQLAQTQSRPSESEIEERKTEVMNQVEAKRTEVKEKLDQKRKEICEKRSDKINSIADRSVVQSKKHLEVFQKIEERVIAFYESKDFALENFEALKTAADEKELAAVAAIEVSKEINFDCDTQDASNVGGAIKDLMQSRQAALQDYRTAIKDLIANVKDAAKTASNNSATEKRPEESTADNSEDQ